MASAGLDACSLKLELSILHSVDDDHDYDDVEYKGIDTCIVDLLLLHNLLSKFTHYITFTHFHINKHIFHKFWWVPPG